MAKQYVVYTVVVGGYDDIHQPLVVDDRFDYVLFTDIIKSNYIGVWQVRLFDYKNIDKIRESRYPKMHPTELLSEYDASLYIDGKLQIMGEDIYDKCVSFFKNGIDWGGVMVPERNDIYSECFYIAREQHEAIVRTLEWGFLLRKENYPRNSGLMDNCVIFRIHNTRVARADSFWWELYERYLKRDQPLLPYVFWKNQGLRKESLSPVDKGPYPWLGNTMRAHGHSIKKTASSVKDLFLHALNRTFNEMIEKQQRFDNTFYSLCDYRPSFSRWLFIVWSLFIIIVYGPIAKYRSWSRKRREACL